MQNLCRQSVKREREDITAIVWQKGKEGETSAKICSKMQKVLLTIIVIAVSE